MKVRATRLTDAAGSALATSPHLTLGREYVVLAISVQLRAPRPQTMVQLITDAGGRINGLFNLADFEITDDQPSRHWRMSFEDSHFQMQPEAWMVPSFWETFYNESPQVTVPDATERFDRAVRALFDEAGAPWTGEPPPWSARDIRAR